MPLVVIAGAPGAGKTTLLAELAHLGHHTVSDSAREVIRGRKAIGLSPRPEPLEFASEVLKRDSAKYQLALRLDGLVFFERCGLEALAMLQAAQPDTQSLEGADAPHFVFHKQFFIVPPSKEIYTTDSERDHSFEHALRVHQDLMKFYPALGYKLFEVPRGSVVQRAAFVLRSLTAHAGAA